MRLPRPENAVGGERWEDLRAAMAAAFPLRRPDRSMPAGVFSRPLPSADRGTEVPGSRGGRCAHPLPGVTDAYPPYSRVRRDGTGAHKESARNPRSSLTSYWGGGVRAASSQCWGGLTCLDRRSVRSQGRPPPWSGRISVRRASCPRVMPKIPRWFSTWPAAGSAAGSFPPNLRCVRPPIRI